MNSFIKSVKNVVRLLQPDWDAHYIKYPGSSMSYWQMRYASSNASDCLAIVRNNISVMYETVSISTSNEICEVLIQKVRRICREAACLSEVDRLRFYHWYKIKEQLFVVVHFWFSVCDLLLLNEFLIELDQYKPYDLTLKQWLIKLELEISSGIQSIDEVSKDLDRIIQFYRHYFILSNKGTKSIQNDLNAAMDQFKNIENFDETLNSNTQEIKDQITEQAKKWFQGAYRYSLGQSIILYLFCFILFILLIGGSMVTNKKTSFLPVLNFNNLPNCDKIVDETFVDSSSSHPNTPPQETENVQIEESKQGEEETKKDETRSEENSPENGDTPKEEANPDSNDSQNENAGQKEDETAETKASENVETKADDSTETKADDNTETKADDSTETKADEQAEIPSETENQVDDTSENQKANEEDDKTTPQSEADSQDNKEASPDAQPTQSDSKHDPEGASLDKTDDSPTNNQRETDNYQECLIFRSQSIHYQVKKIFFFYIFLAPFLMFAYIYILQQFEDSEVHCMKTYMRYMKSADKLRQLIKEIEDLLHENL